jgi:hypothetical protein
MISLFVLSAPALGQVTPVIESTASDITDILADKTLQKNTEIAKKTSDLEDLIANNDCNENIDTEPSCQGYAQSLMPSKYKDQGWKTLFEIKYQPLKITSASKNYAFLRSYLNFSDYRIATKTLLSELKTDQELEAETQKILSWYQSQGQTEIDAFSIKTNLIIEQFKNPDFFPPGNSLKQNNDLMFSRIRTYSQGMNDEEFLRFSSAIAGYVDYNYDRASFIQTNEAGLGVATPFEQIINSKTGICGDIHGMVAKIGELRGWETFTIGYALESAQHVVTAMVDPKNPQSLKIVNYGTYEEHSLNDGNSVRPVPVTQGIGYSEIGMQMRIFKNDQTGNPLGKMEQIATIPTALGSFMNDLFKKSSQISKAMPQNQNYNMKKVEGETNRSQVNLSSNGKKISDKIAGEGIVIYEGETENALVYGIAVDHHVYKNIYRYDPKEGKCVLKKNKYFSLGVAGNLVDLNEAQVNNAFYVYLNMKGGTIFHIYQTENFQFKGIIGYELEGFGSTYNGQFLSGDGNLSTLFGVVADYKSKGINIHTGVTYETNVGMRNQNLMTDFSSIPSNINPFSFNAISLDANLSAPLNDKTTFITNNNLTLTHVGGRVLLSSGIIHDKTSVMASYQGGVGAIPIGNSLQNVNLLQNFNNMDGFRITVGHQFTNQKGTLSGSFSGYGGVSTSTSSPLPMAGASLKINLNGKKRKPAATPTP